MEEKTEAVKGEETTVGLTMNYNPFSFISCQEDALVLAGCISHGLDADVIKKSGGPFRDRPRHASRCVCLPALSPGRRFDEHAGSRRSSAERHQP